MTFYYQEHGYYFASCAAGLESLLLDELVGLGAENAKVGTRGVSFKADHKILYQCLFGTRLASRMFAPLAQFACPEEKVLYRVTKKIPWEKLIQKGDTFAISAHTFQSRIDHSQFAMQRTKDGLVDRLRDLHGDRPDVDVHKPSVSINLRIQKNHATLSLDLGAGPLSHRGYRKETVEAPLAENLAAAVVNLSGWKGETPLWDPMCGSGTLLAEALMVAGNMPAGLLRRHWGVWAMPDFDGPLWDQIQEQAKGAMVPVEPGLLRGSDKDVWAVGAAKKNLACLPGGKGVTLRQKDFQNMADFENGMLLSNPPFGIRLEDTEAAEILLGELGTFMKHHCPGTNALLFLGDKELLKKVGLKSDWRKPISAGGLDARIAKYTMFAGKRKNRFEKAPPENAE